MAGGSAEFVIANEEARAVTVILAEASVLVLTAFVSLVCLAPMSPVMTGPPVLVAVMTTAVLLVTSGAVKSPVLEIVPVLADQRTAVFEVPVTRAVNCICSRDATVALSGVSESATAELAEGEAEGALCEAPPHAVVSRIKQSKSARLTKCGTRFLSPCSAFVAFECSTSHITVTSERSWGDHRSSP